MRSPKVRILSNAPEFLTELKVLTEESEKIAVASSTAARNDAFTWLRLTELAVLEVLPVRSPLITVVRDRLG